MATSSLSSAWKSLPGAASGVVRQFGHKLSAVTAWCADQWARDKDRVVLWIPVFLGAGVALYFSIHTEPPAHSALLVALPIILGLICLPRGRLPLVRMWLFALLLAAIGFELAQLRTWSLTAPTLSEIDRPRTVSGQVFKVSQMSPSGVKLLLSPSSIEHVKAEDLPRRLKVTVRSKRPDLMPGDWVEFPAILGPPPGPVSPGAFDFRRLYWFDQIGGVGFAIGTVKLIDPQRKNTFWETCALTAARFRASVTSRIQLSLPGEEGAVASALMTGERTAISKDDLQALRDSGLAHLLAISGLHMGLAGFGIFLAVRFLLSLSETLTLHYPIKKWAAGAALFGILFYLVASGMAVSAQRAFIMAGVVFIAMMLDRSAFTLRTVAIAATAIICVTPEVVVEAGFQMSFSAVICLVAAYEFIRSQNFSYVARFWDRPAAWSAIYVVGIIITSLVASMATSPMAAYHFHRVPHYSVLGDLVAMPLMAFVVMPSAIVTFLTIPFGLEYAPLQLMGWGIRQILSVGQYVSAIPGAVTGVPAWPPAAFGLIVLGGLWLCLWRETWRVLGLPIMATGLTIGLMTDQPDILVSGDGNQVLYRSQSGFVALDARRKKFEAEAWLRRAGDLRPLKAAASKDSAPHRCDATGCAATLHTQHLMAISLDLDSLYEDCMRADVVISVRPIRGECIGPELVIDKFDLWRNGTYAIWLTQDAISYTTNKAAEGDRLWTRRGS